MKHLITTCFFGLSFRGGTMYFLVEKNIVDHKLMYGSWAGAFGNFQFMPSTIKSYAIDYDKNNKSSSTNKSSVSDK